MKLDLICSKSDVFLSKRYIKIYTCCLSSQLLESLSEKMDTFCKYLHTIRVVTIKKGLGWSFVELSLFQPQNSIALGIFL